MLVISEIACDTYVQKCEQQDKLVNVQFYNSNPKLGYPKYIDLKCFGIFYTIYTCLQGGGGGQVTPKTAKIDL